MDLEVLSQKELAELAYILEEQEEAYSTATLDLYKPHAGQEAFHKSKAKIRVVVTGNRWGKTTASIIEACWLALGIHPYHSIPIPNRGKLYGESFSMIDETIKIKFDEWLPKKFLSRKKPYTYNQWGHLSGINFANGSRTVINTYDQHEKKAEGSNWNYCGFDEPPSREIYVANLRGLVDFGGLMWFTCTPLSEAWIYDDLWLPGVQGKNSEIECFSGSIYENPHLNRASIDLFVSELKPTEREVRVEGKFKRLQGLVIDTYDSELSDIDPFLLGPNFTIYEGIDPHSSKPHCALWKAIDPSGRRFVVGELSCSDGLYKFAEGLSQVRRALERHGAKLSRSIADTSLNQNDPRYRSNMRDELIGYLRAFGETVFPENAQKKDWLHPGIIKVKDLYRPVNQVVKGQSILAPMQYVFKTCKLYKHNLTHYQWPKNNQENWADNVNPIKVDDDFLDCDRYIESIAPEYQTPGASGLVYNNSYAYTRRSAMPDFVERTLSGVPGPHHFSMDLSSPSPVSIKDHQRPENPGVMSYRTGQRSIRYSNFFRGLPK